MYTQSQKHMFTDDSLYRCSTGSYAGCLPYWRGLFWGWGDLHGGQYFAPVAKILCYGAALSFLLVLVHLSGKVTATPQPDRTYLVKARGWPIFRYEFTHGVVTMHKSQQSEMNGFAFAKPPTSFSETINPCAKVTALVAENEIISFLLAKPQPPGDRTREAVADDATKIVRTPRRPRQKMRRVLEK